MTLRAQLGQSDDEDADLDDEFEGDDRPRLERRSTSEFVRPENFFDPPSEEEKAAVTAHVTDAASEDNASEDDASEDGDDASREAPEDAGALEEVSQPEDAAASAPEGDEDANEQEQDEGDED